MLKQHFLHAVCHNSDMFRSILIILRELLNIIKAYINNISFYICINEYVFVYALVTFSNSLRMINADRNMKLWEKLCVKSVILMLVYSLVLSHVLFINV